MGGGVEFDGALGGAVRGDGGGGGVIAVLSMAVSLRFVSGLNAMGEFAGKGVWEEVVCSVPVLGA